MYNLYYKMIMMKMMMKKINNKVVEINNKVMKNRVKQKMKNDIKILIICI